MITGASTGMALAGARLFADEGAHVFITGRRQEALDEAVKLIGANVTAVQGDAASLDDLDRLFDTVNKKRARSTCCGQAPERASSAGSVRSPRSISMPPSG